MKFHLEWLFLFHLMIPSAAYYASSVIKISDSSFDVSDYLRQAAQILNVVEPGNIQTF